MSTGGRARNRMIRQRQVTERKEGQVTTAEGGGR